jgi:hypothetical protein
MIVTFLIAVGALLAAVVGCASVNPRLPQPPDTRSPDGPESVPR